MKRRIGLKELNVITLILIGLLFNVNAIYAQGKINDATIKEITYPTITFHGQIQYDFEFLKIKNTNLKQEDYNLKGQEFRRLQLLALGTVRKNIHYKIQFELARGTLIYRDVYIKFSSLPIIKGNLTLGSFAEPTGLEKATSGKNITFLERAMLTCTQNNRWNSGFLYDNFDLLNGNVGLQLSYGFNGDSQTAFKDKSIDQGHHLVARLTSPIYKKDKYLIHLGVNMEMRKRSDTTEDYTLKFRPENHMGNKISIAFIDLENQNDLGFEIAAVIGPFSVQAEYEKATYNTINESISIDSYYGFISYFMTGESRAYKKGVFGQNKPNKDFSAKNGHFGALELVARYSIFDYSETSSDAFDNKVNNLTAGLNWYLNANTRFMYNYVLTDFNSRGDNNLLTANTFRAQVDF